MNKIFIITGALLIMLFAVSCDNQLGLEPNALVETRDYFPMHVGDEWNYQFNGSQSYELNVMVTGTETFGAHEYFVFRYTTQNTWQTYYQYFRTEGRDRVYKYQNGVDMLHIDFDRSENDSASWRNSGYVNLNQSEDNRKSAGFDNCITVEYDAQDTYSSRISEIYAPGVGLVKRQSGAGILLFIDAKIDGRKVEFE
ncbi:MAG: hypothetical protein ACOCX7_01745 [Bacteroidota bacterium]